MPARLKASPIVLENLKNGSGNRHTALACLTFDDGPDPVYSPLILDLLAEQKTRASFFVVGRAAEQFPQLIKRMVDEGHVVGNHTYSHRHPWMISTHRARLEVSRATQVIQKITGQPPRWFRPPHGCLRRAMLNQAQAESMTTVLWSHSVIDWGPLGTASGIAKRLSKIKSGDIVLMHDGRRQHNHPNLIAEQLPGLIEWLAQRGIVPVTLDDAAG